MTLLHSMGTQRIAVVGQLLVKVAELLSTRFRRKSRKSQALIMCQKSTIHRLTVAPNKKFTASRHYLSKVNAKVPRKRNDKRKESLDAHYYASRVKYRVEFASKYSEQ